MKTRCWWGGRSGQLAPIMRRMRKDEWLQSLQMLVGPLQGGVQDYSKHSRRRVIAITN